MQKQCAENSVQSLQGEHTGHWAAEAVSIQDFSSGFPQAERTPHLPSHLCIPKQNPMPQILKIPFLAQNMGRYCPREQETPVPWSGPSLSHHPTEQPPPPTPASPPPRPVSSS